MLGTSLRTTLTALSWLAWLAGILALWGQEGNHGWIAAVVPLAITSLLLGSAAGLGANLALLAALLASHWGGQHQAPLWGGEVLLVPLAGLALTYALEQRRQSMRHRSVSHRAQFDPLTGLHNRASFEARLVELVAETKERRNLLAVLFVDLDRFKTVNDTFGHEVGDELLKAVARTLQQNVRQNDLVARLGGDEFILAMPNLREPQSAAAVAQKLLRVLNSPFEIRGKTVSVGASIGISLCPSDGEDIATLVKSADHAMYKIKSSGKNQYAFSTVDLRRDHSRRQELERRLRWALEKSELELLYQPQVELQTGNMVAVEALLRWRSPELGLIGPREFVPIAEESGLIIEIGHWALREACRQAAEWRRAGHDLSVAVNLSPLQLAQANLVDMVGAALRDGGLPAERLIIEVTEAVFGSEPDEAVGKLRQLDRLGVTVALDDFGSGFSSLGLLTTLPVRSLKIETAFTAAIASDNAAQAAVVEAICALASKLGKTVVAEGVESDAQRQFLAERNCDLAQGHLFSKPVPASQISALLAGAFLPSRRRLERAAELLARD